MAPDNNNCNLIRPV